jgi:hypothetical protein
MDESVGRTPRAFPSTVWIVVASVGVPLMLVQAVGLDALGANSTATALGASIIATFLAGRLAHIRGAIGWSVAGLLVFVIAGLLGLFLLPWDMPG